MTCHHIRISNKSFVKLSEDHLSNNPFDNKTHKRETSAIPMDNIKIIMSLIPPTKDWPKFSGDGEYDFMDLITLIDNLVTDIPGIPDYRLFETLIELAKNFLVGERLSRMIYDNYGKNNSIWMRKSKIWTTTHLPIKHTQELSDDRDQLITSALKYTTAACTLLGDPNFLNGTEILQFKKFTSKIFANKIFKKIDDKQTYGFLHYNPHYDLQEDHGTTHLTVIDWMGSTISLTSTINMIFGSELMDQRTGIILNNELDDFSIPGRWNDFNLSPSPLNYPEKGSISPVVVEVGS
ncbi:gamma-glutamyltranspeptidase-domain-containing protein [Phakopsora pachyrhizi]|nr:gamma-glutamyltranspeptidase-domain-containing protein [Phakopsora pachyrhizi]